MNNMLLADLLKIVTPDAIAQAMKSNPVVVQAALQKFEAYSSLGRALTVPQQVCISNNLDKLDKFFKTDKGKACVSLLAEEFVLFTK